MSEDKFSCLDDLVNEPFGPHVIHHRVSDSSSIDLPANMDVLNIQSLISNHENQSHQASQQAMFRFLIEISRQNQIQLKILSSEITSFREEINKSTDQKFHELFVFIKNLNQEILDETTFLKKENSALKNELNITRSMINNFFEYLPSSNRGLSPSSKNVQKFEPHLLTFPTNPPSPTANGRLQPGHNTNLQNSKEASESTGLHSIFNNGNNQGSNYSNRGTFNMLQPRERFHSAVESDFIRDNASNFDFLYSGLHSLRFNNQVHYNSVHLNNTSAYPINKLDPLPSSNLADISSGSKVPANFHPKSTIFSTSDNFKINSSADRLQLMPNSLAQSPEINSLSNSSDTIHSPPIPSSHPLLPNPGFNSPQNILPQNPSNSLNSIHDIENIAADNSNFFIADANAYSKTLIRKPLVNEDLDKLIRQLDSQSNGHRNRSYSIATSARETLDTIHSVSTPPPEKADPRNYIVALDENVNPKLESPTLTSKENPQNALLRLKWRIKNVSVLAAHSPTNESITSTFSDPDCVLGQILLKITIYSSQTSCNNWTNNRYGLALSISNKKTITYVFQCGEERKPPRTHNFARTEWDGYDEIGKFGDYVDTTSNTLNIILDILDIY